jgi:uncharacterized protein
MPESSFRFSPNPNRASEIQWRSWGAAAFDEAAVLQRPVLLNLTAVWCHWCHLMDETTYSDPAIIRLINEELISIRVDADRYPHVQDRYIAGGWPTTAFLTPTGEVLWAGTYTEPEQLAAVASSVLGAWRDRRDELELEIGRRRRAFEAAQRRTGGLGLVRREPADDVLTAIQDAFDARNGGFGEAPKFPQTDAIELLYISMSEDERHGVMADQTLDGMLAGELWDCVEGGFFRYATGADWTAPRHEKLLDTNAALLEAYSLGAVLRGRDDWRTIAARTVAWADATLLLDNGLWAGSQSADPAYFAAADGRATMRRPPVDPTIYTSWNARWIGALALAGARLGVTDWTVRAATALETVLSTMSTAGGGLFHYCAPDTDPQHDFLLADTLECIRAALAVAQATGAPCWVATAQRLAHHMEANYWAEDGGFWDRARSDQDIGALRYRERAFEANATAARLLLDLSQVTGERSWHVLAELTLARIGAHAGRYGASGAALAVAIGAFFDGSPAVFVTVPDGTDFAAPAVAAMRQAAFALGVPAVRVWTVSSGHALGPQHFTATVGPAAYVCSRRGCSAPVSAVDRLAAAAAGVVSP